MRACRSGGHCRGLCVNERAGRAGPILADPGAIMTFGVGPKVAAAQMGNGQEAKPSAPPLTRRQALDETCGAFSCFSSIAADVLDPTGLAVARLWRPRGSDRPFD
jgi:hypothetical protein